MISTMIEVRDKVDSLEDDVEDICQKLGDDDETDTIMEKLSELEEQINNCYSGISDINYGFPNYDLMSKIEEVDSALSGVSSDISSLRSVADSIDSNTCFLSGDIDSAKSDIVSAIDTVKSDY